MSKNTPEHTALSAQESGYIEGYYGRLFSFAERLDILDRLQSLGCNTYLYAPKEDSYHRFEWRVPYEREWLSDFTLFCNQSKTKQISVWAGIAPGLDFNFFGPSDDFDRLAHKAETLLHAGADRLVLLFDDVSDDVSPFKQHGLNEAACHGKLATRLYEKFHVPVVLVPRLYSDEIDGDAGVYAQALNAELHPNIAVMLCGKQIVARQINAHNIGKVGETIRHRKLIWDNFYCNDYCPRRLFVGPYIGRKDDHPILLNGTGMPQTDQFLLCVYKGQGFAETCAEWGVPAAFQTVSSFFARPIFSDEQPDALNLSPAEERNILAALEELLWSWKSPIAREWYPFLFGLKQDILLYQKEMDALRIAKTHSAALYSVLTRN